MISSRAKVVLVASLGIVVLGSAWVYAQQRQVDGTLRSSVTGTFGPSGAEPAYVVVSTSTPVLFTTQITDPQLKKRSVVLVRLDAMGQPTNIIGRLQDDGGNGDKTANDSIYSLRVMLNESTFGSASFKVAARFKSGNWHEPEADDDDWDAQLSNFKNGNRDLPAQQQDFLKLVKWLDRYTFSDLIRISIWQALNDPTLGVSFSYPPDWTVVSALDGNGLVISYSTSSANSIPGSIRGLCKIGIGEFEKPATQSLMEWRDLRRNSRFSAIVSSVPVVINGLSGVREVAEERARTDTFFLSLSSTRILSAQLTCGQDVATIGTAVLERVVSTLKLL